MYYLAKWQERVNQFTEHDQYKELTNELGIMRMMLEQILNQCEDSQDLLRHSARVTSAVDKIQKLVETIDKMDSRRALSPENLASLAQRWVQIINVYIQDPEVLDRLSQDLIGTLDHEQLLPES